VITPTFEEPRTPVPPADLCYRVTANTDPESFHASGGNVLARIAAMLDALDRPLATFARVLDFGCGCGRIARWLPASLAVTDCDIDAEAIAWCQANLPRGTFVVSDALPPLPFPDGAFDLIYGLSVLTHLSEDAQFLWLEELRRVARPGGLVLLSVRGDGYTDSLTDEERITLRENGFVFTESAFWDGLFPSWYNSTQHMRAYVEREFAPYFDVLAYLPEGVAGRYRSQDWVALGRADGDPPAPDPGRRERVLRAHADAAERRLAAVRAALHEAISTVDAAAAYARNLEGQVATLTAGVVRADDHARRLDEQVASLRAALAESTAYARAVETEYALLRAAHKEATAYARGLEALLAGGVPQPPPASRPPD